MSKSQRGVVILDGLIGRYGATKRQKNLLPSCLARNNIRADAGTIAEERTLRLVLVCVGRIATLVSKVGPWISFGLIWKLIQETNVYDIDVRIGAEVRERLLIWSLTLCDCQKRLNLIMTMRLTQ